VCRCVLLKTKNKHSIFVNLVVYIVAYDVERSLSSNPVVYDDI